MTKRKRVLFVCLGNACRSQMAEAFTRAYGGDVLIPASAGLAPATKLPPDTLRAMSEKNLDISAQFPKSLSQMDLREFDLVINMSGYPLPSDSGPLIREWDVPDPICLAYDDHCHIRDDIEARVMELIRELRWSQKRMVKFR